MFSIPLLQGQTPRWSWMPSACHVCGTWPAQPVGQAICADCLGAFVTATDRCRTCAQVWAHPVMACGECLNHPLGLRCCVAAVDYAYPWDQWVARFKFHGDTAWANVFASLMASAPGAAELLDRCDRFVPLPLTAQRLGKRGYNQTWLLTKALARQHAHRHKPWTDGLVKWQDTPTQQGLNRSDRLVNLRSAFVVPTHALTEISGQRILLIDDIMTTGATLRAAAQALTMAGAAEVNALVFARTPRA